MPNNQNAAKLEPPKNVWLRFVALVPLAAVLALCSWLHIRSVCSTHTVWPAPIENGESYEAFGEADVAFGTPGVVEVTSVDHYPTGAASVTLRALGEGETTVTFGDERLSTQWDISVRDGAVIEGGVNFSGWQSIHLALCIFLGALTAVFASAFVTLRRRRWFDYEMVACGGGLLFSLFQFLLFVYLWARHSLVDFVNLAYLISFAADYFLILTFIPMGVLALLVSISNISLILHEGRRLTNLLGIALSVAWLLSLYLYYRWQTSHFVSTLPFEFAELVACLISVAIVYGECLLLSTIVCAWVASRHTPRHAADYLVVLGCGLRPDGTPCPLLAGRVDKACEFDASHVADGDKPATFVPSGGQGLDEVISEAESMRNYLVQKGVAPERIVLEDRSTTTRENMKYSREVIEGHSGRDVRDVSVAFSTTNYHVFRGYVCAHQAGMLVEGMGSKTKAYFWPNAFLREFAGLLASQWKGILQSYFIIALIYALAEYVLILA